MNPDDFNKTDLSPNPAPAGQPSVDGFISPRVSMGQNTPALNQSTSDINTVDQQLSNALSSKPAKGKKAVATLFAVLFVLALAGAGYLYTLYSSAKQDLDDQKATSASLRASLEDARTASDTDAEALEAQADYVDELNATAEQLKTLCAAACASIVIPVAPTPTPSLTPTPTTTATPTPTPTPTPIIEDL